MSGSPISYISGPQDPSQLENYLNQVITAVNAVLIGSTPASTPTAQSTAQTIAGYGVVTVNTTTRTASSTGRYTIAAPIAGRQVIIKSLSTVKATITGLFERSKVKITMSTTASLATAKLPSVILRAISTSAWALVGAYGPVTVSS